MVRIISENWELDNIDAVLFDKDGTIIDLHYFWGKMTEMRALAIIKRFGITKDFFSKICLFLGYDFETKKMLSDGITALYSRVKIIEIFKTELEKIEVFTSEAEIEKIFDEVSLVFYKDIEKYIKPIQESVDLILKLKSMGVKIGIVTSDSVESTNLMINLYNWHDIFDVVIGRESCNETKESGVPTRKALEILGISPKNTIMIGDAPMDYISAKNAGIDKAILVATGQILKEDLKNVSNYVLESLKEIECLKI